MGKQQSQQGDRDRGRAQQGSRARSEQGLHQPQQGRDVQRNKQSDRGQQQQQRERGQDQQNVYGEGNYAASRKYNEATKDFTESGRVESAARNAEPRSADEAAQMSAAEAEGRRHAKGEDPALNRKSGERGSESRTPKPGEEEE